MIKKHKTTEYTEKISNNFLFSVFRVFRGKGYNMHRIYENKITMEPDEMIGNVLDLTELIITGEAIQNQEKGFLAYEKIVCREQGAECSNSRE